MIDEPVEPAENQPAVARVRRSGPSPYVVRDDSKSPKRGASLVLEPSSSAARLLHGSGGAGPAPSRRASQAADGGLEPAVRDAKKLAREHEIKALRDDAERLKRQIADADALIRGARAQLTRERVRLRVAREAVIAQLAALEDLAGERPLAVASRFATTQWAHSAADKTKLISMLEQQVGVLTSELEDLCDTLAARGERCGRERLGRARRARRPRGRRRHRLARHARAALARRARDDGRAARARAVRAAVAAPPRELRRAASAAVADPPAPPKAAEEGRRGRLRPLVESGGGAASVPVRGGAEPTDQFVTRLGA